MGSLAAKGDGFVLDLRHHHNARQPFSGPTAKPRQDPVAEERANRDRRSKAEEFGFWLHDVDRLVNTSIARWRRYRS